jgi:hypothetical protein
MSVPEQLVLKDGLKAFTVLGFMLYILLAVYPPET